MKKKLRQITDNIHGTIFLSELESQLASTPFFYRLHDIYQSSTVYLTFPSNRTKRYEHSLGTMELTSQIFFAAIANAKNEDRIAFMNQLYESILDISNRFADEDVDGIGYLGEKQEIKQALPLHYLKEENLEKLIENAIKKDVLGDSALEHFAVCFFDSLNQGDANDTVQIAKYLYVYQAVLEAIRISALFHDVGHPPYSHVIEEILEEIYEECKKDQRLEIKRFNAQKSDKLIKSLRNFIRDENSRSLKERGLTFLLPMTEDEEKLINEMAMHEQVGVRMMQLAIEDVFPKLIREINNDKSYEVEEKAGKSLYYIIVVEFVFAILLEKSMIFTSIHRIIDGILDSDRLDYIVRDSQNAGIDWGRIPYKRILNSATLVRKNKETKSFFTVAYPEKVRDDIEDILLMRYKIFVRINFHHRSVKTATLLQNAVKELAFDYLESDSESAISDEIAGLWTSLGATLGDRALQVIQWNDSWLITVLYDALVKLNDKNQFNAYARHKENDKLIKIKDLLEEVLLNHKIYYPVLKRKCDNIQLINEVFACSRLKTRVNSTRKRENEKLLKKEITEEQRLEAEESLRRLNLFDKVLEEGDFELFQIVFPTFKNPIEIVKDTLKSEQEKGNIRGYYILVHGGRNKKGLPRLDGNETEQIYLYDNMGHIYRFNGKDTIDMQINALRTTCLNFYIYVKPNMERSIPENTITEVRKAIAKAFGKELRKTYEELFPTKHRTK